METGHSVSMAGGRDMSLAGAPEPEVGSINKQDLDVLGHLMAGGQLLAAQQASRSDWSPEKKLAGAVLASALVEIRDHHGSPAYRRRIAEDLEWILSDDDEWPFSFRRLCAVFDLDPVWVREVVQRWISTPRHLRDRPACPYRQAA
jgi:hypothetical protein